MLILVNLCDIITLVIVVSKNFFDRLAIKIILQSVIPILYGITYSVYFSWGINNKMDWLLFLSLLLTVIHIISVVVYGVLEHKQKANVQNAEKLNKKVEAITKACKEVDELVRDSSDKFYEIVKNKKNHSEIKDWHLLQYKGDMICNSLFNLVKELSVSGKNISVSAMFKKEESGKIWYTMISRKTDNNSITPRTYKNFIDENEADGFYYKTIFDKNCTKPQILPNKKSIISNFKLNDPRNCNYSQYIGIPILCKNKIIGILQVIAYENSIIAKNKKELMVLCNNYFSLYASLFLLSDKLENIDQLVKELGV